MAEPPAFPCSPSTLHVQVFYADGVGVQDGVHHAHLFRGRFQQHGTGSVAEDGSRGAVLVIDHERHLFRTEHDDFLESSRFDQRGSRGEPHDEARAGGLYVVGQCSLDAHTFADAGGGGGELVVGRGGGADNQVDVLHIGLALGQQFFHGFGSQVGGAFVFVFQYVARFDADAGHDPFIAGIHHGAKFLIGQNVIRQIASHGGYDGMNFV